MDRTALSAGIIAERGRIVEETLAHGVGYVRAVVEDYERRAGPSLDLEDYDADEAARLVAEGRETR